MPTAQSLGGLPAPRVVEPEPLPEPPESDIFNDFTMFGERIARLMTDASERQSQTKRCTPFTTQGDGQVILRRRKPRPSKRAKNAPTPPAPDRAAGTIAAAGLAVLSLLAIAMVVLSSPKKDESRAVAKRPIEPAPIEAGETHDTKSLPVEIVGTVAEPSE